ncbi:MAG: hypothetical protein COA62_11780 [Rhodobiaceae bacterium]|nr:MAG: hypothetical protein COA62_11780 [Rhodobiaceae bacterium]
MKNMIFVTGFARGGTSWLRDCIGSHSDVQILPRERAVFRDMVSAEEMRQYFNDAIIEADLDPDRPVVNKAPANAPYIAKAALACPESKFIFIIRDPRDVLISHQRGEQRWMGGRNSTVGGCMDKTQSYFEGWLEAEKLPNVLLVRYEDLHQNFFDTMKSIFEFTNLTFDNESIKKIYVENNFRKVTARKNKEKRSDAKRKGVIGDWAIHLKDKDREWFRENSYWSEFMARFGYDWSELTYPAVLDAMHTANCHFLSEDELLDRHVDPDHVNVILFHDIDDLNSSYSFKSILDTARAEAVLGVPAIYNFLPMDDIRYRKTNQDSIEKLIGEIQEINTNAKIALHFNASEKFFPAKDPDYGDDDVDFTEAFAYLNSQIDDYKKVGIRFRTATAHGYGRGKKRPNNRDTPEYTEKLLERDVQLFDTVIRPELYKKATHHCAITDVGGIIQPRGMLQGTSILDKKCYEDMSAGSVLRFLTHPGNYESNNAAVLAMRHFR